MDMGRRSSLKQQQPQQPQQKQHKCCRHLPRVITYCAAVLFSAMFFWILRDHVNKYLAHPTVATVARKPGKQLKVGGVL